MPGLTGTDILAEPAVSIFGTEASGILVWD